MSNTLIMRQTATAVGPSIKAFFQAYEGTGPYTYEVLPGGAGGSINASTGAYQAPAVWDPNPRKAYDTILATDAIGDTIESRILVGSPLRLFCEIIQRELGLDEDRVWIFAQKKNKPNDEKLFVNVNVEEAKYFAADSALKGGVGLDNLSYVTYIMTLGVLIESRSTEALWRKDEVALALISNYSLSQQTLNTFGISKLPISPMRTRYDMDGPAIPYQFYFRINLNCTMPRNVPIEFYDVFNPPEITTEA